MWVSFVLCERHYYKKKATSDISSKCIFYKKIIYRILKTVRVTPAHEKDNPQIPSSYHLISVLSVFRELFAHAKIPCINVYNDF